MFDEDIKDESRRSAVQAVAALRRFERLSEKRIRRAVEREREAHPYTNRTGDAEASTQVIDGPGEGVDLIAMMAVHYAGYLQDGGHSNFVTYMNQALAAIHAHSRKV